MATFVQKLKLLRGLLGDGRAFVGPFYVVVDPTRRCNLNCPGCPYHSSEMDARISPGDQTQLDISVDLFARLCNDLKIMGTRTLVLTGEGEPFLHPSLEVLVSLAKSAGLHVRLLTNGTFLGEKQIEWLTESDLDELKISLWASSPEVYARSYPAGDPAMFQNVTNGLRALADKKRTKGTGLPRVILHQPITRANFETLPQMAELAHETGCDMLSFAPFKTRWGELSHLALSAAEESSALQFLRDIEGRLASLGMEHNIKAVRSRYAAGPDVWKRQPCYIAYIHGRVKVDGSVLVCNPCNLPVGDLKRQSMREIWNGDAMQEFRRQARTGAGLAELSRTCDCEYCCLFTDNMRMHSILRWIGPFWRAT